MRFFDKLFGGGKEGGKTRDQYKDEKYFHKEISRFSEIISDLNQSADASAFTYWSLSRKYQRIIALKYSLGLPVQEIKKDYEDALNYYLKGWEETEASYADLLLMISLGILFEMPAVNFNALEDYTKRTDDNKQLEDWHPDALLWLLLNSKIRGTNTPDSVMFPSIYKRLYDITKLSKQEAEATVKDYLTNWYTLHKTDPWYGTHLKDKGYSGYWAWEVAAVVKVLGLDDSNFKYNPYYPYDIVHWNAS
jgi:hypothetical protein